VQIDAELIAFAWVAVGEGAFNCLLIWLAARAAGLPRREPGTMLASWRELLAESWPLLLAGLTVSLYMRIDMVMLRHLSGDHAAGIYAAAVRLSELWYFVPVALASSLLPGLLLRKAEAAAAYSVQLGRYYDLSAALGYAAALATCLLADPLVRLAYGAGFLGAIPVLRWHAWAVVFVFLGVARSQFLVNEGLSGFHLVATSAGAVLNIALNAWLIPAYGPLGAAWATLAAYGLAAWGASWLHPRVRANAALQSRALLVPLLGWRYLFRR
jgi:PST family polysaccharide transporter